jgi:hypothetical protein
VGERDEVAAGDEGVADVDADAEPIRSASRE